MNNDILGPFWPLSGTFWSPPPDQGPQLPDSRESGWRRRIGADYLGGYLRQNLGVCSSEPQESRDFSGNLDFLEASGHGFVAFSRLIGLFAREAPNGRRVLSRATFRCFSGFSESEGPGQGLAFLRPEGPQK